MHASAAVDGGQMESFLAAIVESSDDAILSKNPHGIITTWNSAATRIFGYQPEEIIGKSVLVLIPPDLQNEEPEILRRLRSGERIEHYETVRLKKNGQRFEVSLTVSPIKDQNGIFIGASKIVRDISSRKEMERLVIQSEKIAATGRMAATIAHEINNPLEAVVNLIFLARTNPTIPEQVRDYLKTAEREIERVSLIARQTLGYFKETMAAVDVDLRELLEEVVLVYESKLHYRRIKLETLFSPTRHVTARRGELTQAFANLVSNAIDSMSNGGGTLTFRLMEDNAHEIPGVSVHIEDQGTGIPEEDKEKIFEPFFTTKSDHGTGIGLWVTRQFIEGHGGSIRVESSTSPGAHGTCFILFIPYNNPDRAKQPRNKKSERMPS